jgi:hypothetical protein
VWPQFVSGLAGRVARRLPVLASTEPTVPADH